MLSPMLTSAPSVTLLGAPVLPARTNDQATHSPPPFWFEIVFWTIGWLFTLSAPAIALGAIAGALGQDLSHFVLPAMFCGQVLGLCLTVFILKSRVGVDWSKIVHLHRPAVSHCFWAVLGLPAVIIVSFGLASLLTQALAPGTDGLYQLLQPVTLVGFFVGLFVHAVGPAVGEELFYRGYLGRLLLGRYRAILGVLLTSAIFGIIHLNVPQAALAFILGLYAHWVYLATRSLWVPILLHFLTNAFARVLMFCGPMDANAEPTDGQLLVVGIVFIAAIVGAIMAGWGLRRVQRGQASA